MRPQPRGTDLPELCERSALLMTGGRREGRVLAAPMAPVRIKMHGAGTTGTRRATGLPCAVVYGLLRALPGDRLSCPRRPRDAKASSPTWHQHRDARTTRLGRPSHRESSSRNPRPTLQRPPHPALNVRDDREAPLFPSAGREQGTSISEKTKAEYF